MRYAIFTWLLLCAVLIQAQGQPAPFAFQKTGTTWTPLDLTEADSLLGMYEADRITGRNNLDTCGYWVNASTFSGKWRDGFQTTDAFKPRYCDSLGQKFLYFDGSNDVIRFDKGGGDTWTRGASIYVVWRYYGAGNPVYRDVFAGPGAQNELYIIPGSEAISWYINTGGDALTGGPSVASLDSTYLSVLKSTGSSITHQMNARSRTYNFGHVNMDICGPSYQYTIRMRVYAVYILNTVLSADNDAKMRNYIKNKYNVNL